MFKAKRKRLINKAEASILWNRRRGISGLFLLISGCAAPWATTRSDLIDDISNLSTENSISSTTDEKKNWGGENHVEIMKKSHQSYCKKKTVSKEMHLGGFDEKKKKKWISKELVLLLGMNPPLQRRFYTFGVKTVPRAVYQRTDL